MVSIFGTVASKSRTFPAGSSPKSKRKPLRHRHCWLLGMIARIQRLDLTVWEMLAVAVAVGLVAAAFVAIPVS